MSNGLIYLLIRSEVKIKLINTNADHRGQGQTAQYTCNKVRGQGQITFLYPIINKVMVKLLSCTFWQMMYLFNLLSYLIYTILNLLILIFCQYKI